MDYNTDKLNFPLMKIVEFSPTAILYLPAIETWLGKG